MPDEHEAVLLDQTASCSASPWAESAWRRESWCSAPRRRTPSGGRDSGATRPPPGPRSRGGRRDAGSGGIEEARLTRLGAEEHELLPEEARSVLTSPGRRARASRPRETTRWDTGEGIAGMLVGSLMLVMESRSPRRESRPRRIAPIRHSARAHLARARAAHVRAHSWSIRPRLECPTDRQIAALSRGDCSGACQLKNRLPGRPGAARKVRPS